MSTDEPDEQLAPLPPEEEARIRALLSGARETGPMPAGVAARLDQVVVGLAADRAVSGTEPHPETGSEATVHPLSRTRRLRVVAVLGAAAAVVVLALGVGAFIDRDPEGVNDASMADSGAVDRGEEADEDVAREQESLGTSGEQAPTEAGSDAPWVMRIVTDRGAYPVSARQLTRDLARIQDEVLASPGVARYGKAKIYEPRGFSCPSADYGRGILVAARYDGDPAYVVFRQPMGDTQVVEVLQCGTGDLLRSTTLPTR